MKKVTKLALYFIGTMLLFASCQKEKINPSVQTKTTTEQNRINALPADNQALLLNLSDPSLVNEFTIGIIHNKLLADYLKNNPQINTTNYTTQLPIAMDFFCTQLEKNKLDVNPYRADLNALGKDFSNYFQDAVQGDSKILKNQMDKFIVGFEHLGPFSSQTTGFLREYQQVFTSNNTYIEIITKSTAINARAQLSNLKEFEKEFFNGMNSIATGSSTFWGTSGTANPQGFIFGDCVGYLAGWGSTLYSEWYSSGTISRKNSNHRVGQGLIWGMAGSAVGF